MFLTILVMCSILLSTKVSASSDFVINTNDFGQKVLVEYTGDENEVSVPDGVEIVEGFTDKKNIEKVILPDSVKEIGQYAFSGCINLKKINLPKSLKRIWNGAFMGCESLEKITINKKLKQIDEFAFSSCTGFKSIKVAKGNKKFTIYKGALCSKNMKKLYVYPVARKSRTKYTIPKSIKVVDVCAFYKNKYLKKIVIEGRVSGREGAFSECESLKKVIFKKAYKRMVDFSNCKNLKKVILAEGTKRIGDEQFSGCVNLETINFPSTLKRIDRYAFKGCEKIVKPEFADTVTVDEEAFE